MVINSLWMAVSAKQAKQSPAIATARAGERTRVKELEQDRTTDFGRYT